MGGWVIFNCSGPAHLLSHHLGARRLLLSTEMLAAQVTLCVAMIVDWCHLKYVGGWMGWLHNLQNLISFCDPRSQHWGLLLLPANMPTHNITRHSHPCQLSGGQCSQLLRPGGLLWRQTCSSMMGSPSDSCDKRDKSDRHSQLCDNIWNSCQNAWCKNVKIGLAVARGGQRMSMTTAMTMLSVMMMTSFGLTVDSDKGGLC